MKTTRDLLWILAGFYAVVTVAYVWWTAVAGERGIEWVGAVAFALMFAFSAFIAWYLGLENKPFKVKLLPEDRLDAEISDADEELGFFAPQSLWPIMLAGVIGLIFLSIAFGWWPAFFFAPFLLIALGGWVYEFYRGRYGH